MRTKKHPYLVYGYVTHVGDRRGWRTQYGIPFSVDGLEFYAVKNSWMYDGDDGWTVTHKDTGMIAAHGETLAKAKENAARIAHVIWEKLEYGTAKQIALLMMGARDYAETHNWPDEIPENVITENYKTLSVHV